MTRLLSRQVTPSQVQQSVPGFHELSMPDGSELIPDLKANRPVSSSTWQVAAEASWVRNMDKRMKKIAGERGLHFKFIFCVLAKKL